MLEVPASPGGTLIHLVSSVLVSSTDTISADDGQAEYDWQA